MSELDISELVAELNKELKMTSVQVAGSSKSLDLERLPVGSLTYDLCTGGGFPLGRHIVLSGVESSGKTTAALLALAEYQKSGDKRFSVIIDAEYALDKRYATALGVDMNKVIIVQPDHLVEGHEVLLSLLRKNAIGYFIVDSIAALLPKSVMENPADASNIGKHAQAIGNMFKQTNSFVGTNKVVGVWINQIRDAIGGYGGGISLPGGHAQKFYASIMIQVNRGARVDNADGTHINRGKIKTTKNKTFAPYQEGEYDMHHGTGICVSREVIDYGVAYGVLYKKGHSVYYDETFENDPENRKNHILLGAGKDAARDFLNDNPELREVLYKTILNTAID
jgi:recombination protein RecA